MTGMFGVKEKGKGKDIGGVRRPRASRAPCPAVWRAVLRRGRGRRRRGRRRTGRFSSTGRGGGGRRRRGSGRWLRSWLPVCRRR